ncbi:hypothetical protein [Roseomonas sp. BN140053]
MAHDVLLHAAALPRTPTAVAEWGAVGTWWWSRSVLAAGLVFPGFAVAAG